jgi:hypothetical protein
MTDVQTSADGTAECRPDAFDDRAAEHCALVPFPFDNPGRAELRMAYHAGFRLTHE